ncbi:MAG: hypothetical protein Q7J64_03055 [Elusimicrobiota bacterium]|nr:hypothetical protein [Elusimicrobiota bacterium]
MEQLKQALAQLKQPRTLGIIALALAIGAAGAGIGWKIYLEPHRAIARTRFQAHNTLVRMYDLQMAHREAHGSFANDIDALLAAAPDAVAIRANLKSSVDLATLAVIGDEKRFRLEANVLDPLRTSVKIRGPVGER